LGDGKGQRCPAGCRKPKQGQCRRLKPARDDKKQFIGTAEAVPCYKAPVYAMNL